MSYLTSSHEGLSQPEVPQNPMSLEEWAMSIVLGSQDRSVETMSGVAEERLLMRGSWGP